MDTFFRYLSYSTPLTLLFCIIITIQKFSQFKIHHKILFYYLVSSLLTDQLYRYFGGLGFNIFIVPFFAILELCIFSGMFYWGYSKKAPSIIYASLVFILMIAIDLTFISELFNPEKYQTYSKVISNIGIISFTLHFLFKEISTDHFDQIKIRFILIILVYFSINLIIFSSLNFLVNESLHIVNIFWIINALSTVTFYILITIHLWQHGKIQKPLQFG